jgi:hypothetical protein
MVTNDADLAPDVFARLQSFAPRYMWWKSPERAILFPYQLMARTMDLGTFEDTKALVELVGTDVLREVIHRAEIGWFRPRSWHFWHYKLDLASDVREIPPVPGERFV